MIDNLIRYIKIYNLGVVFNSLSFKDLTTLGIGGKIKYVYYPNSLESFILVYKKIVNRKIKYFLIGNGSNILASDEDYDGIVISLKRIKKYEIKDNILKIDAGATNKELIRITKEGYGGLEEISSIPGTIGGLIYQNASFNKVSVSDRLIKVECIDHNGNLLSLKKDDLDFGYRKSIFKNKELIILRAYFNIDDKGDYQKIVNYYNIKKHNQPLKYKNAGCFFKNNDNIPSWKIIKELEIENINDACISNQHANFLINKNKASFFDMEILINNIKNKAKEKGYNLELEIEIING